MAEAARTPRAEFAVRVLRYLAAEAGVRQFLELSPCGGPDTGEVVRRIAPEALVVRPDGERDARRVISRRLDPSRQVAVLWLGPSPGAPAAGPRGGAGEPAVGRRDGAAVIAGVMAAVPSGSYLALCCADPRWLTGRLAGLALVEPGLVPVSDWRPDYPPAPVSGPVTAHGALARKP